MAIRKFKATVEREPVVVEFEIDEDDVEVNEDTIIEAMWEAYDECDTHCTGINIITEELK